jgi:hypothetical protein
MTNATMRAFGLAVALALLALAAPATAAATSGACKACHADLAAVLPPGHPPAKGTALGACLGCHKPGAKREARNGFAAALHRAHAKAQGGLACAACHAVVTRGRPGVAGGRVVLVASRDTMALATATMTAAGADGWTAGVHAKAGVSCASCHGAGVPPPGAEAANERCLACHGPLATLVEKTKPAEHADRNPHRSHLGEIACTVCHRGHEASTVYCLDCHPKFPMTLRTAAPR